MSAKAAFSRLSGSQRIDGQLTRASGGTAIDVVDPATEERVGQVADATADDVGRAVAAANTAQRVWRKVNHHRRAELLHEVARRVMADRALVAEMLTREMGKPYKESWDEVGWSASAIDYYAEIARH
jgi:acyl-CoA reductase-like NAD-dependent aldehyde dehydrogenase